MAPVYKVSHTYLECGGLDSITPSRARVCRVPEELLTACLVCNNKQPGQHAFAELSDSDSTHQHLAQLSGQMKAMKELLETQGALLRQLDAERQRSSDLEEQVRELKLENARTHLEGVGGLHLPEMDTLEDLPLPGSRSSRSTGRSKDGEGMLQLVGRASHGASVIPMLYMASW